MYKNIIFWSRLKFIIFALYTLLLILGCFGDKSTNIMQPTEPPIVTPDKPPTTTPSISFTLDRVPNKPPNVHTWIITDSGNEATTKDFLRLKNLLNDVVDNKITLIFPNIRAIPNNAFFIDSNDENKTLISVSALKAETIGNSAFRNFIALKSIDFPEAISIGSTAFSYAESLTNINLPEAISIGSTAFSYTKSLTNINLPKSTSIEKRAFSYATALITITIATESDLELVLHPTGLFNVNTDNITVTTSQGTVENDKKWKVGGKTFGPFEEVIITE